IPGYIPGGLSASTFASPRIEKRLGKNWRLNRIFGVLAAISCLGRMSQSHRFLDSLLQNLPPWYNNPVGMMLRWTNCPGF
ncbi:MAG: hypothetical protein WBK24_07795, partial [Dethiobacteria bacterium]